ncbi:MAG: GAF domain-containing protein [Clostridiales bacterium]
MHKLKNSNISSKDELYNELCFNLKSIIDGESDLIANLSNASALLFNTLSDINWSGFYLWKENELVLGPFQGKPACIRIKKGQGVCGASVLEKKIILVSDVNKFPNHIPCDSDSKSEIVLPIIKNNILIGVLDIDSPIIDRFDFEDSKGLSTFVKIILENM